MIPERYKELSKSNSLPLTQEEIKAGWHFCYEYDGMLVGPGMDVAGCLCFKE